MRYQQLGETDLNVSEVGFGVWTVATNWWGKIEPDDAVALLQKAFDLGVNFYDTADAYSDGYGEEILAKALGKHRKNVIIGTKFGYDIYSDTPRDGHKERAQDFSPEFIRHACEMSLRRLGTDYIDLYQLHNPKLDALERDDMFELLADLVKEGKIREYAVAVGPDIGWFEEGEASMRERHIRAMQIIYSILEQEPARQFFAIAEEEKTGLISRVPHASGLLDGTYNKDTVFEPSDHRSHRRQLWLDEGLKRLVHLDYLTEGLSSTIGQIAIKFCLAAPKIVSVLPNITNMDQLHEFTAAPESEEIPQEFLDRAFELHDENFYLEPVEETSAAE